MNQCRSIPSVKKNKISLENIISAISIVFIVGGISASIYMNYVNRSLWLDEAMLAYSFSNRSFFQLWRGPLEYLQSAPLGWLYLEKSLSILLGNTEAVLRIGSIIGFVLTILVLYLLLQHIAVSYPFRFLACAFYANMPFILLYSNMFKPYIFDGFIVLFAILVWLLYEHGHIGIRLLIIIWTVSIWFSTPVCFLLGGLLIVGVISCLIGKDIQKLKCLVLIGTLILLSFVVCYYFWLGDKSVVDGMHIYWKDKSFPLIPNSYDDLNKLREMATDIFQHFGVYSNVFVLMLFITLIYAIKQKQTVVIGCYIGIFLALFASWIGMFPIKDRMWLFIYPLIIFLAQYGFFYLSREESRLSCLSLCLIAGMVFYPKFQIKGALFAFLIAFALEELIEGKNVLNTQTAFTLVLYLFLVFSAQGISQYWKNPDTIFRSGEELNTEIAYLEKNLQDDEHIYVYYYSVPGIKYKIGYDNDSIAGYKGNVTFGNNVFLKTTETEQHDDWITTRDGYFPVDYDCEDEINEVIGREKVYIVSSHISEQRMKRLIDAVHENGFLQLVSYEYMTPLWFFCRNIEDSKIHVSYETKNLTDNYNEEMATVLINNEGAAYINHQFEEVSLVNVMTGERFGLPQNIQPGSSIELTVSFEKDTNPTFRLENEYGSICEESDYKPYD